MSQPATEENPGPPTRRRSFFGRLKGSAKAEKKAEPPVDYFKVDLAPVNRVATGFLASRRGTETRALNNDPSTGKKTSVVDSAIYIPTVPDNDRDESESEDTPSKPTLEYYESCTKACARYKSCLSKYLGASSGAAEAEVSSFDKPMTVEDVERALVNTCDYLETVQGQKEDRRKSKDVAGRLRGAFAGFRRQAQNVQSFLSLLPAASEFGSVICGGLSILLEAAKSYEILEQNFHHALREIKTALVNKAYIDEMHPPDAKMHRFISDLFASIFGILEHLMHWILQSKMSRVGKAVMTHATYADKLTSSVDEMRLCADALCTYGKHRQRMIGERTVKLGFAATGDGIRVLDKKMDDVTELLQGLALQVAKARVEKMVHQMVVDIMNDGSFSASKVAKRRPRSRIIQFDVKSFLSSLQKRLRLAARDAESVTRGTILSRDEEKTFSELSQHVRLKAFFQTDRSHVMLLEGGTMGGRTTGRSPITLLSAKLFNACQTMQKTESRFIFSVGYFCSEHRVFKADGTPLDLIITMILQLIEQHQGFDPALLADFEQKMGAKQRDIHGLCSIFASCVTALPPYSTLFVLVEGLGRWEDPSPRVADMTVVLEMLLQLGRTESTTEPGENNASAKVKCLFTTPTKTIKYKDQFEPFEVFACLDRLGSSTLVSSPGRPRRAQ